MPTQTVKSDGAIIPPVDVPDHPGAIPQLVPGSHIQAAAASVNDKTETQAEALNILGGKTGGRRRRQTRKRMANLRRVQRIMMMRGGADVEVKNVPSMPSAGGVDPKATFAGILGAQHQLAADKQFDGLGHSSPVSIPPPGGVASGGRRRTKKKAGSKHKKTHGTRPVHRPLRKHRRSRLRTLRVRRSRR